MVISNEIPVPLTAAPSELQEPYLYLEGLTQAELEEVKSSILLQLKLESKRTLQNYWENLLVVIEHKLQTISSMFTEEITKILSGKDISQLTAMKSQILQYIDNPTLDRNYWQEVLSSISVFQAKLELKNQYTIFSEENSKKISKTPDLASISANNLQIKSFFFRVEQPKINFGTGEDSPLLVSEEDVLGFEIITEDQDHSSYLESRKRILERELCLLKQSKSRLSITNSPLLQYDNKLLEISAADKIVSGDINQSIDDIMKIEIMKKMPPDANENEFSELVNIRPVVEDWMKKYKPRKPKFFNRIKTGYEWNRHNQTHYDHKNPPPKVVQGYKFNVFYPYLIDKTKAPQFYLEPNENNETCTIRFHSGPPYEDIAFKIVNREWDFSDRNGFKCFFDKGVLHLYFNFKRHRYKR